MIHDIIEKYTKPKIDKFHRPILKNYLPIDKHANYFNNNCDKHKL